MGKIEVSLYGASHAEAIGVRISGIEKGTPISTYDIDMLLKRRKAVKAPWSTPRIEADRYEFISGVEDGLATGAAIDARIRNTNTVSSDYPAFIPRPSHADYVSFVKDALDRITPGGGRFSGRLTAPLCIAGGIAKGILRKKGIEINAYVVNIGGVRGKGYYDGATPEEIAADKEAPYAISEGEKMLELIAAARAAGDSVGGAVECVITGLGVGVGDFYTSGIESAVSYEVFGVPAVKAVEFGSGTAFADMHGSVANDPFRYENGKVVTETNNSGGINGGISNGMPVVFRATLRPTPSISKPQKSVDLSTHENVELALRGRHDACIVPRAAAAVEAAAAIAVLKLTEE